MYLPGKEDKGDVFVYLLDDRAHTPTNTIFSPRVLVFDIFVLFLNSIKKIIFQTREACLYIYWMIEHIHHRIQYCFPQFLVFANLFFVLWLNSILILKRIYFPDKGGVFVHL